MESEIIEKDIQDNKENFKNFIHEALSRDIFAKGALKRAESLFQAKPGLYDLSSFK